MLKPFRYRICLCNSRPGRRVQRTGQILPEGWSTVNSARIFCKGFY